VTEPMYPAPPVTKTFMPERYRGDRSPGPTNGIRGRLEKFAGAHDELGQSRARAAPNLKSNRVKSNERGNATTCIGGNV
jgi:hypothetical protein